jgi:hypothetical protein
MGTSNRSGGSQFLHDLITVDFSKVDPYGAVKVATLIAPLIVVDIPNPSSDLMSSLIKFESIVIGALLSFLTLFVFWIIPKIRSNQASRLFLR